MAWRLPGDNPSSEPMMVSVLTHICVTRPQWVKDINYDLSADSFGHQIRRKMSEGLKGVHPSGCYLHRKKGYQDSPIQQNNWPICEIQENISTEIRHESLISPCRWEVGNTHQTSSAILRWRTGFEMCFEIIVNVYGNNSNVCVACWWPDTVICWTICKHSDDRIRCEICLEPVLVNVLFIEYKAHRI